MNSRLAMPLQFAFILAGCGASPPPVVEKPHATAPLARLEVAAAAVEPPFSDAPPEDMTARLHAENLEMSWQNALRLTRVMGAPLPSLPPQLVAVGLLGPSIASVIDLEGPVDAAFFGTDFDRFAVAIPIAAEMQPRLGKSFQLRAHRGLWRIESRGEDGEESSNGALGACAFVGIEDESGARVVCASDESLLEASALYLGRAVMREERDGDVRLELLGGQLFGRIADEAGDGNTNDWAEAAGERYAVEFFRDIRQLSLVGSWGKSDIEAESVLSFRKDMSHFSRALTARVPLQSPSTASFARLPRDSAIAMHGHSGDANALVPIRDEFLDSFSKEMRGDNYDPVMLETFNKQLSNLVFTGGSYAFAYGVDRAAAEKALAAYAKDKKKPALRAAAYRSLRGWSIFAVDEPTEKWTRGIEEVVRLGNELDKKRNGGVAVSNVTPVKGHDENDRTTSNFAVIAPPASLPKGSLHVEVKTRPLKKDAPPAYTRHIYVVPDGSRTWIGFGEDEVPMLARLKAAREGLPDQTLSGVPELANTASQGALAAGFVSIAGGTFLLLDDDSDEKLDAALGEITELGTLPGHGDGIIPWQIVSESGRTRIKAKLSLPVLGDIAEMAKR